MWSLDRLCLAPSSSDGQPGWLSQPEKAASGWDFLPCPDMEDRHASLCVKVLIGSGGLNAALRCASSCQPCSRRIGTPLGSWGEALDEAFPDSIYSWRRTLHCSLGSLTQNLYYACLFSFYLLDCEPLKTGIVSYHCFNTQSLWCISNKCLFNEILMFTSFLRHGTPSCARIELYQKLYQLSSVGTYTNET